MLDKLHHIGISCENLAQTVEFYRELGGMLLAYSTVEGDASTSIAWMRMPDGTAYELVRTAQSAGGSEQTMDHIAYSASDIDDLAERLQIIGAETESGPADVVLRFDRTVDELDGLFPSAIGKSVALRVVFFRGPNGERLEAAQETANGAAAVVNRR